MERKIVLLLLVFATLFIITGCKKKKDNSEGVDNIKIVSNIELGKKQYIEQLKKVSIDGTDDYLIITKKIKWEVPEHEDGETVSFAINIPYTLHVDGKDYSAQYCLNDCYGQNQGVDGNPKYVFEITNLTSNYETEILINKK